MGLRRTALAICGIVVCTIASLVLAQTPTQATIRTSSGDKPLQIVTVGGVTFFPAMEVMAALGGTVAPDNTGFKVTYNNVSAAFGPDSRFGVVRDDLIEMPVPPIVVDGRPYVPWQFFNGLLARTSDLEAVWDSASRTLLVRPQQRSIVGVQVSVANVQGTTRIVATLSSPAEYAIAKEEGTFTIRFRNPIRPPFAEQAYEDPNVSRIVFSGTEMRLQLTAPEVVGDSYTLANPLRIVLDLRKGTAPAAGSGPAPGPAVPGIPPRPQDVPGIRTIVIDPGHGGKEIGAIGPNGLMEKDATLALCRRLSAALAAKIGARVVLTREDDSVVPLDQRTALANQYKADLFLSVHMNAAVVKGAHGSETYFLSLEASDELARKAAEAENAAGSMSQQPAGGGDLKLILWDLAQQDYLHESSRLAQVIQEEMNAATGVESRGVKQAPFKVLVGATMPAALVEVAFISNPEEEAKLRNEEFINRVVEALTNAVRRYKTEYETRIGIVQPKPAAPAATATTTKGTGR